MTTYHVTAWCSVPYYASFEVEADSKEEALDKASLQVQDECAGPCDSVEFHWDEFEIHSGADESDSLTHLKPARTLEIAAPALLAALSRFEEAWRNWADDMRGHPAMAQSCEMFAIYEQARAAITKATKP